MSRRTICDLNFFKKFWTVLDFLQKPLAWFSKFYRSVQRKICGRNNFFKLLFSETFSDFERNRFRLLAKKLQDVFKTTFYVSRGTVCGFFFKKFWTVLDFLSKPLWWFSKFYLRVQSKVCGRNRFFFSFLFRFFSDFEQKNFQTFGQKTSRCFLNYLLRIQRNILRLFFHKVSKRFGFSAETFMMVLKILSTCPE